MIDAVVAGHICLDIIPSLSGKLAFEPGRLVEAGAATLSTGGAVSNTGLALNRLGVDVRLVGKIGDDLFAGCVRQLLDHRQPGLGEAMSIAPGEFTSYTVVINLSGEDRMFLHAPGCNNTFVATDVPDSALESARLMHFGYPPLMARMFAHEGRELESLMKRAKALGCCTSLDMSLPDKDSPSGKAPWADILARVLPYVDIFLPSYDELGYMLGGDDPLVLADQAICLGTKIVGLKLGEKGFLLRTSDQVSDTGRVSFSPEWNSVLTTEACYQVDVAGTTGSGDATIAGFLMGVLRGFAPQEAARSAVAVGACCCEKADSTSGIRTWDATAQRIASGWAKR